MCGKSFDRNTERWPETSPSPCAQFELLNAELEQNQELANSRMAELEKLQQELQEAVKESEKLKVVGNTWLSGVSWLFTVLRCLCWDCSPAVVYSSFGKWYIW